MKQIIKILLLISLGWFLASRLLFGTLNFYIHPRFNGLTLTTAVVFIIMAIVIWWQTIGRSEFGETTDEPHDHDHDDHHGHHHAHDVPWSALLLLAIPIVLGVLVQPRPLGANALINREVSINTLNSTQAPSGSDLSTVRLGTDSNILDWLYAFQRTDDLTSFVGEEATVSGFVYRDERFTAETFMVSRFTVSCCVADANPVGLIVDWGASPELVDDEWVEVNGRFELQTFNGIEMPILVAETVTPVDPPNQPYLYQ